MEIKDVVQFYPFVRVALAMSAGIVFFDKFPTLLPASVLLVLTLACAFAAMIMRGRPLGTSMLMLVAAFLLGGVNVVLFSNDGFIKNEMPFAEYDAVVVSEPADRPKTVACDLMVFTKSGNKKIKAYIRKDFSVHRERQLKIGDGLKIYASLVPVKQFKSSSTFDYVRWMQVHDYKGQTFISENNWYKCATDLSRLSVMRRATLSLLRFRKGMTEHLGFYDIDKKTRSVLLAMTLGDKSMLDDDTRNVFSATGSSHVLALSGLHLGIFYFFIMVLLGTKRHPLLVQICALTLVWTYVLLVGMPVSVVRSAIMVTIAGCVFLVNGQPVSLNSLSFAAVIMMLFNPMVLWDVSFQLSFLAVASIAGCYKIIMPALNGKRLPLLKKAVQATLLTPVAAQVGTAPLVMYYFGTFPLCFLLSNIVVVPAATVIMGSFIVVILLTPVAPLQALAVKFMAVAASLMIAALEWIAKFPWAVVSDIRISLLQVVLLYVLLLCCFGIAYYARKIWLKSHSALLAFDK